MAAVSVFVDDAIRGDLPLVCARDAVNRLEATPRRR